MPVELTQYNRNRFSQLRGYKLGQGGAFNFLVNDEGEKVSDGFHEIEILRFIDNTGKRIKTNSPKLIGKMGAETRFIQLPAEENSFFESTENGFHEIDFDPGLDLLIGITGAMKCVIDTQGNKLSEEYHDIFIQGGKLYGSIGDKWDPHYIEEEVTLPEDYHPF